MKNDEPGVTHYESDGVMYNEGQWEPDWRETLHLGWHLWCLTQKKLAELG